jgi:hypothetical protein
MARIISIMEKRDFVMAQTFYNIIHFEFGNYIHCGIIIIIIKSIIKLI